MRRNFNLRFFKKKSDIFFLNKKKYEKFIKLYFLILMIFLIFSLIGLLYLTKEKFENKKKFNETQKKFMKFTIVLGIILSGSVIINSIYHFIISKGKRINLLFLLLDICIFVGLIFLLQEKFLDKNDFNEHQENFMKLTIVLFWISGLFDISILFLMLFIKKTYEIYRINEQNYNDIMAKKNRKKFKKIKIVI